MIGVCPGRSGRSLSLARRPAGAPLARAGGPGYGPIGDLVWIMTHTHWNTLRSRCLAGAASILLALGAGATPSETPAAAGDQPVPPAPEAGAVAEPAVSPSAGWIADEADNVCGVRSARHITNPATLRYSELLDATPEVQRMKRDGITRESAQGQVLYAAAVDRVSKAAQRVMQARSHCSVWKQVRHQDGRGVPDISSEVKAEL